MLSYIKPLAQLSSNINEVIGTVLNPLIFFYKKLLHAPKAPKASKAPKSTNTQPSKSTKRYERTKIKTALKKHLRAKSHLFAYLSFCACEEKNRKVPTIKCTKNTDISTNRFM